MKEWISWEDVEEYISDVAEFYKDKQINGVYGLPRGGLVLAVMLSHRMNIPLLMAPVDNCIIIDDICDSGESLLHYVKNSSGEKQNKYHITTMFYNKKSNIPVEFNKYYKNNNWIVYPWEVE